MELSDNFRKKVNPRYFSFLECLIFCELEECLYLEPKSINLQPIYNVVFDNERILPQFSVDILICKGHPLLDKRIIYLSYIISLECHLKKNYLDGIYIKKIFIQTIPSSLVLQYEYCLRKQLLLHIVWSMFSYHSSKSSTSIAIQCTMCILELTFPAIISTEMKLGSKIPQFIILN